VSRKEKEYVYEPWGPQAIFIDKCLNPEEIYIAKWSKKQVRFLSYFTALIQLIEKTMHIDVAWLNDLRVAYMKLSKFEDGYCIKMSKDVARGGLSRMFLNIARWKKIWYSEEEPE